MSFWRDRPVFVTGATGILGGWLVAELVHLGADVVCLVRDWIPQSEFVRSGIINRVKTVRGDVTDLGVLERTLGEFEIDTVFHLAAQTIVGIANRNPLSTLETNVRGTWLLLEACRRSPLIRQVIVASSDKAYGDHGDDIYAEDSPLSGAYPYDASKTCSDLVAQMYATSFGLPLAITRCGNFYGGGDLNWNRLVPGTIRSLLRGEPPIVRSDGRMVREYLYIEDAVRAYLQLCEALAADRSLAGEAFNFSTESPLSVLEMVDKIRELMGRADLAPRVLGQTSGEIARQRLSSRKACDRLNWSAGFTLDEGLRRTIAWYSRFLATEELEIHSV